MENLFIITGHQLRMLLPKVGQGNVPVKNGIRVFRFGGHVVHGIILVDRQPRRARREACLRGTVPLHGGPCAVPGETVDPSHGLLL